MKLPNIRPGTLLLRHTDNYPEADVYVGRVYRFEKFNENGSVMVYEAPYGLRLDYFTILRTKTYYEKFT